MDSYDRYTILQNDLQERPYFFSRGGSKVNPLLQREQNYCRNRLAPRKALSEKIIFVGTGDAHISCILWPNVLYMHKYLIVVHFILKDASK